MDSQADKAGGRISITNVATAEASNEGKSMSFKTSDPLLFEAAKAKLKANRAFSKAWDGYYANCGNLTLPEFWPLLSLFRDEVDTYYFGYKRSNGVKQAAGEFFRKTLTQESQQTNPKYDFDTACAFSITYSEVSEALSKKLARLFDMHGDSFGDLMDGLPMAGQAFYEKVIAGELRKENQLNIAVRTAFQNSDPKSAQRWTKLILEGENYFEMSLSDCAKKYALSVIATEARDTANEE